MGCHRARATAGARPTQRVLGAGASAWTKSVPCPCTRSSAQPQPQVAGMEAGPFPSHKVASPGVWALERAHRCHTRRPSMRSLLAPDPIRRMRARKRAHSRAHQRNRKPSQGLSAGASTWMAFVSRPCARFGTRPQPWDVASPPTPLSPPKKTRPAQAPVPHPARSRTRSLCTAAAGRRWRPLPHQPPTPAAPRAAPGTLSNRISMQGSGGPFVANCAQLSAIAMAAPAQHSVSP